MNIKPFSVDQLIADDRHYVRYGDSCWIVITGKNSRGRPPPSRNSSGHSLQIAGLGEDIMKTLMIPNENTTYGVMPICIRGWPEEIQSFNIDWHQGDLWKDLYVSKSPDTGKFIRWLHRKRVCLVGPQHLRNIKTYTPDHFIVSYRDSYLHREDVTKRLYDNQDDYDVVIFSAGLMTQMVIWELGRREDFNPKMIDTGAHWDIYAGVRSRDYHKAGTRVELQYNTSK